jgi:mono/diheme cytochrome c family protein
MKNRLGLAAMWLVYSACRGGDGDLPEPYRSLAVPEERLRSPAAREHGRALFLQNCALCHGDHADGRGVRRQALSSPPRDFTDRTWRARTSPRRVFHVIREGSHGTAMPAWKSLEESDAWDLTAYLLAVGERP